MRHKTFHMGGVHPDANKFAHSAPVETFPLPDEAVVYSQSRPDSRCCEMTV